MLNNQSHLFNLPESVTYLNCAYMSPMLKSVAAIGHEAINLKDNPTQILPHHFFENPRRLREEFAKLINVDNPDLCAAVPAVSYAMATVAHNLEAEKGDNIVMVDEQFPSNIYPWKFLEAKKGVTLKVVKAPKESEGRGKLWNERILEAIDSKTKLIAMGHVHWADGTVFNLKEIRKRSAEVGALLAIDGTQSIGALPFDTQEIKPDMVVAAGYKWLLGPYSTGVAYYGDYFQGRSPIENSWMHRLGSEDFAGLVNYEDAYQPGSIRFEVGESANFILTPMITEAVRQLNEWGVQNIQNYCKELIQAPIQELQALGYSVENEEYRSNHLFGIRLPESMDIAVLKQRFADMNIFVSQRGNSVRVAPHLYNSANDMDRLLEGFKALNYA